MILQKKLNILNSVVYVCRILIMSRESFNLHKLQEYNKRQISTTIPSTQRSYFIKKSIHFANNKVHKDHISSAL